MNAACKWLALVGLTAALGLTAGAAWAQTASPDLGPTLGPQPLGSQPAGAPPAAMDPTIAASGVRSVDIPRGRSAIVDLPTDARDVLVTDPKVADAVLRSPRRIYVLGVGPGQTDAVFFDAAGRRILSLNIRVDQNFAAIGQTIDRILPGAEVHVDAVNNSVILSGQVANAVDADRAVQIAQQFTDKPGEVVNMLSIADKEQVMLKVRIAEVQRNIIKQLGFNLSATIGQVGSPQFMIASAATYGVNGALLGGASGGYSMDTTTEPETTIASSNPVLNGLPIVCRSACTNGGQGVVSTIQNTAGSTGFNKGAGTIQAFEQVGLVRTLAEPNLTAISGESAKFLAGGEFPVPTGIDQTGQVTITFKPYGVGLGFTPVVLSDGRISLKISTEVSELSQIGEFTLSTGSTSPGLTVPGLTVRRAETTVELPSGGSMMIAGLLQDEVKQDIASLPGLTNLPVLGALFRSRDFLSGETELVVIITPYIVKPVGADQLQTPADGLQIASDAQTILLGSLNKAYKAPPSADAAAHNYQGPVGYVIE